MTRRRRMLRRWWRDEAGSATVETTLIAPLLILLLVVVAVVLHRGVDARIRVNDVAHQAARAATLEREPAAAAAAARHTAEAALADAGLACAPLTVVTDVGTFAPGSSVTVRVSCRADLGEAAIPGLGWRTITASAVEVVDTWRGDYTPGAAP